MGDLRSARVNGIRLAYEVAGPPDGPALVLLHALGETRKDWASVMPALAGSHRVYALDLRGHGDSDRPGDYSLELMCADVAGFLDELGLVPAIVVGHSMGAFVGYLLAERRPPAVQRLVLEEPPPPLPATPPRTVPERPAGDLDFDWAVVPQLTGQRNAPDPRWWDDLAAITARTLVIAGGPDSHLPQDQIAALAARIPDGRLVTIPAGHLVHDTRPAEFLAEVRGFLAD